MFKFKKNEIVYIVKKYNLKPTQYIKCKILMGITTTDWNINLTRNCKPWEVIEKQKTQIYTVETDNSETSHYSTNSNNQYIEYNENELINLKEYRLAKLKKLSRKKYLNFSQKKFFEFKWLKHFLKK